MVSSSWLAVICSYMVSSSWLAVICSYMVSSSWLAVICSYMVSRSWIAVICSYMVSSSWLAIYHRPDLQNNKDSRIYHRLAARLHTLIFTCNVIWWADQWYLPWIMLIVWMQTNWLNARWNEDDSGDALKHFHLCVVWTHLEGEVAGSC